MVAVQGRAGVGAGTVADALAGAGVTVCEAGAQDADVDVVVIAEVLKPEDRAAVAGTDRPCVVVLNKADLSGFARGGPIAVAQARADQFRTVTGIPTVPMVAHLAVAALDAELLGALAVLAETPADLGSVDRFVDGEHPVARALRRRLLDTLDVFGIAHAVLATRTYGSSAGAKLPAILRRLSRVDAVIDQVAAASAEVTYRRVCAASAELDRLAIDDRRVAALVCSDALVLARMAAAVDVVRAAGLAVELGDDVASQQRCAVRWRNYSRGPVSLLHHGCGADIARGSLRRLARTAGGGHR